MALASQIRGARGLLGWSQKRLADAAGISRITIARVETDQGIEVTQESKAAIQRALEKAGVIFVEENGDGPGVRLKKRRPRRGSVPVDELNAKNDE